MRIAKIDNEGVILDVHLAGELLEDYVECPEWCGIGMNIADPEPVDEVAPEQISAALTKAVQAHLDAAAKARGYDGILSAASYAGDPHPPFSTEGVAYRDWRGAVWSTCYAIMADVQAGSRPVPTAAELIADLPALTFPSGE